MDIFHTLGWQEISLRLGTAMITGAVVGLNRELRGKPAGLRTNALVSVGAALLIIGGVGITSGADSVHQADVMSRMMQGIITGIGFLGAGLTLVILVLGKPLERFIHRKFPKLSDHDDVPPKP